MQIVYFDGRDRHELDVRVNNPSATVDDLAVALDPRGAERTLLIADHPADPDFELTEAGLHEGAVVRFGPPRAVDRVVPPPPPAPVLGGEPARELVVVNGLDAGRRFPLVLGTLVIGRAPGCEVLLRDGTLSRRHAGITATPDGEVTIEDYGSHNGTWVAGEAVLERVPLAEGVPLRLGALDLEVRAVRDDDRPVAVDPLRHTTAAGTIPFNRPPRPAPPPPTPELRAPQAPRSGHGKVPFSLLGCLAPLALAGGMYATTKSPQMLMFAALTPIMAVANAIDGKRKGRKSERSEKERFARELIEFRERLAGVVDAERSRREHACPDPAEIVRRVVLPSTMLWERRPGHADFLNLRAGVGDVPWRPPIPDVDITPDAPDELRAALDEHAVLAGSPVPVDLSEGGVVGIVGDRPAALALARSLLCQAAILHGPADLPTMILARPETAPAWDWAKWMPHTRDSSGSGRMLSSDPEMSTRLVDGRLKAWAASERSGPRSVRREARPTGPPLLVVVDDELLTEGRKAPTRSLLRGEGGPVAGIVIASTADRLPAVCTTVVEMTDPDGGADLTLPQRGEHIAGFLPAGMADDVARDCARALARFEDPELDLVGAGLPATIRLLPLLEMEECTPDAVLARWKAAGPDPRPAGPVGVTEDGVFSVDFVADGPHALVGGTTGAGKSELLRTLVASLAASVDPDHLTFVLIDFKGGSAFDECARLPHTVGMVTDLDEHLAERALRCLEAELKYRERALREAAAVDLPDYLRKGLPEPMPRLLVIIDEFATLKAELPEFIDALVGVAQRGRSLGVHMLLATQRPQGAINDNIKANTNMRIALRVQEDGDSRDIIDVTDAAAISRTAPGRAYVRLGPNEVVAIQSALSTGSRDSASLAHVDVARFVYGPSPRQELPPLPVDPAAAAVVAGDGVDGVPPPGHTDLALLVSAITDAFTATGRPAPRRPWPDPLPADIDLDALIDASIEAGRAQVGPGARGFVPLALADDPEAQAQYPVGWHRHEGNLVVYGIGGSGTTTALTTLALSLARTQSPDDLHMYAMDFGAGELGAIAPLPHVGAVILAAERERQTRLMRYLRTELDRRRDLGAAAVRDEPAIVTFVDGWTSLVSEYNDLAGSAHWEAFTRVFADGPEVGLFTVVAADRAGAVSHALASLVRQRLALRLGDKGDYSSFGIRMANVPDMVPGRAITIADRQVVQIARPAGGPEAAARRIASSIPAPARPPVRMDVLTTEVRLADLGAAAGLGARPWTIPIGVAESARATAHLVAYQGEHALIVGPARSGKSTALLTVAAACRAARADVRVVAVAGPRSPIGADPLVDQAIHPNQIGEGLLPVVEPGDGLVLVLVDDAEAIDDVGGVLDKLSTSDRADLLFVAAGRNDGVRTGYSHWTRPLRRSKLGVMLRPDVDLDGDIFGTRLPRRSPVAMVAGRGYLAANGNVELVQVALPR